MSIISISGKLGSGKDTVGKIIQYLTYTGMYSEGRGMSFQGFLENYHCFEPSWQIKKWAGSLRKVAAILLEMNEEFLYTDEFKQMVLPECWATYEWSYTWSTMSHRTNREDYLIKLSDSDYRVSRIAMTGRMFLQKLGTDAIRNGLHINAWVNALMSEYKPIQYHDGGKFYHKNEYPNWIITDTRFPNELAAVKEKGGIIIKVKRYPGFMSEGYDKYQQSLHPSETTLDSAEFNYTIINDGSIEDLIEKVKDVLEKIKII